MKPKPFNPNAITPDRIARGDITPHHLRLSNEPTNVSRFRRTKTTPRAAIGQRVNPKRGFTESDVIALLACAAGVIFGLAIVAWLGMEAAK